MERDQIIKQIRANRENLKSKGVEHLAMFGSRVRSTARSDSDLDVLVDIDATLTEFSLIDLAGVCALLTSITVVETTAIERHMLARQPGLARRIADDIVEVF